MKGLSKKLIDRIELLGSKLAACNNKNDGRHIVAQEIKYLQNTYADSTARAYLSLMRKHFSNTQPYYSKLLRLPNRKQKAIEKRQAKQLKSNHSNLMTLTERQIIEIEAAAVDAIQTGGTFETIAGLCFLTGRRMTEIVKTGKFRKIPNKARALRFSGQLKAKGETGAFVIPTLQDAAIVQAGVKKVRKAIKASNLTNMEVHNKYETSINQAVKKVFGRWLFRVEGGLSSHKLRALYSEVCAHRFNQYSNESNVSYVAGILGHSEDDIQTALSYQKFKIK